MIEEPSPGADLKDARPSAHADPFDRVAGLLQNAQTRGSGLRATCPAHDDHNPSLDVDRADNGVVLLKCRSANCSAEAIVAALGLEMRDLFPNGRQDPTLPPRPKGKRELKRHATLAKAVRAAHWSATDGKFAGKVTTYAYHDHAGEPVGAVIRVDFGDGRPKAIRRVSRDGAAWMCRDMPAPKPLYRLPALLAAAPDEPVLLPEGEKCVDACESLGFVAATSSGGAHAPLDATDWSPLAGRRVIILPDNDAAGHRYCAAAAEQARSVGAAAVLVLELDGLNEGGDVFDWAEQRYAAGQTRDAVTSELRTLLTTAKEAPTDSPNGGESAEPEESHENKLVKLGTRNPADGRLVLSPSKTPPTAEAFVREFYTHADGRTFHNYAGLPYAWLGNAYREIEEEAIKNVLAPWLHASLQYVYSKKLGRLILVDFDSNPATVRSALATIKTHCYRPANTLAPCWLNPAAARFPANEILSCKSENLHIPTGTIFQATPNLFSFSALDFDHEPHFGEPLRWMHFLAEVFDGDSQSIELLQEWFGYLLTTDGRFHKALLMVGPRRSGKGTIARVLARLIGTANVVGPTVASLGTNFGLQPLLGKSLAIVSDARFVGENIGIVVERVLCITGKDAITVDRKFLSSVTVTLPTRFMFLTNELPRFSDSSTALAGRFVVLLTRRSFFGHENTQLTEELLTELPGILNWAIDGWRRLRQRARFTEPSACTAAIRDLEDLTSPVQAFVRECCTVGAGHRVPIDVIYSAWQSWCFRDGRNTATTKQVFGRDLAAAVAGITRRRGSENVPFYEGIGLSGEDRQ